MCIAFYSRLSNIQAQNQLDEISDASTSHSSATDVVNSRVKRAFSEANFDDENNKDGISDAKASKIFRAHEAELPNLAPDGNIDVISTDYEIQPPVVRNNFVQTQSVVPYWFPDIILNDKNLKQFKNFLLQSSSEIRLGFDIIENGMIKVKPLDEATLIIIQNQVKKLAFCPTGSSYQCPLIILPHELDNARYRLSCVVDKRIDGKKFLTSIGSQNELDSSLWFFNYNEELGDKKFMIHFSVDPKSFLKLMRNDYMLQLDGTKVKVNVDEDPLKVYMSGFVFNRKED